MWNHITLRAEHVRWGMWLGAVEMKPSSWTLPAVACYRESGVNTSCDSSCICWRTLIRPLEHALGVIWFGRWTAFASLLVSGDRGSRGNLLCLFSLLRRPRRCILRCAVKIAALVGVLFSRATVVIWLACNSSPENSALYAFPSIMLWHVDSTCALRDLEVPGTWW